MNNKRSVIIYGPFVFFFAWYEVLLKTNATYPMLAYGYHWFALAHIVDRLGDDAGGSLTGPSSFDNDIWGKLKLAMKY